MLEIPETIHLASQLNQTIQGKTITQVIVNASPHKFAFFYKDPLAYPDLLIGKTIGKAKGIGPLVEIEAEDLRLTFGDGANLRAYVSGNDIPPKHQLMLGFADGSALVVSIQMYGFISAFKANENENPYYLAAQNAISPLSQEFDFEFFKALAQKTDQKLSLKAFLATQQRIPGLGNGVLQDILFTSGLNPKTKLNELDPTEFESLYKALKSVLKSMTELGGRDTEKDLFGHEGHYKTIMSKNNLGKPCPKCQSPIIKEAYMGGAIYTCPLCQPKKSVSV